MEEIGAAAARSRPVRTEYNVLALKVMEEFTYVHIFLSQFSAAVFRVPYLVPAYLFILSFLLYISVRCGCCRVKWK